MKLFSILESNVQEALNLSVAKNYAEYIRRPETEKVIDDLMAKLKQQSTFTGKESKRGERIYFEYNNSNGEKPETFNSPVMDGLELDLRNNSETFKEFFGKTYEIENGKDYLDGLTTDSKGVKVGIGKLFNMTIEKLKKKGDEESLKLVQRFEYNRRGFQGDQARNSAISRKNKKTYIVISKANYDIAGMTSGRNWSSCMSLTSGNGQQYIHCDIKEGTLIAYLVDGDDTNIQRPIARLLIKPFISTKNYKDYLYVVETREYGTAPGFSEVVQKMFEQAQPDKDGRYRLNHKLYQDSTDREAILGKKLKVINKEMFDKYVEEDTEDLLYIDCKRLKEFFEISSEYIEVLSGIEAETTISIDGGPNYTSRHNLSRVSEISDVKTNHSLYVEQLSGLTKISNIDSNYLYIEECSRLETIENASVLASIKLDFINLKNLKRISGNAYNITIEYANQEIFDRLDIKDLKIQGFVNIYNFTGTSLEFLKNVNVERAIYVYKSNNIEELPTRIGNDKYSNVTLYLSKRIEEKVKVPEDINYRVSFMS